MCLLSLFLSCNPKKASITKLATLFLLTSNTPLYNPLYICDNSNTLNPPILQCIHLSMVYFDIPTYALQFVWTLRQLHEIFNLFGSERQSKNQKTKNFQCNADEIFSWPCSWQLGFGLSSSVRVQSESINALLN